MDRVLSPTQANLISEALSALRTERAREAGKFITDGNDTAATAALDVAAIDDLTAIIARDDALIIVGYSE